MTDDLQTRLQRQIDFIIEVDKLKQILRRSYVTSGTRLENDAEHSWHIALMTFLLSEYSNTEIDVLRIIKMLLIHDIVEIDAGDCFLYGDATGKEEREQAAADRIFAILPDDQSVELRAFWNEFEEASTPEAKFARALDRLQPILLNIQAHGQTWKDHGVKFEQVINLNPPIITAGSKTLAEYAEKILNDALNKGLLPSS